MSKLIRLATGQKVTQEAVNRLAQTQKRPGKPKPAGAKLAREARERRLGINSGPR